MGWRRWLSSWLVPDLWMLLYAGTAMQSGGLSQIDSGWTLVYNRPEEKSVV
jgi:hypothetical protein